MAAIINSYLVISALGPATPDVVNQFTQSIVNCGGNILNTRMTTMGSEFGIMLLIEGTWGAIAKIETSLPAIEQKLGITISIRRTNPRQLRKKTVTYTVHAVTVDREGIINDLALFFNAQDMNIDDVNAHTYVGNTGTLMSAMTINVNIPVNAHIPTLREKFLLYCDAINLDAALEPFRD